MDHLKAMKVFQRIAERGSLSAASLDLGLSRGGASAVLSELEAYLGVQLIERTTRRLRLTEDGRHYLERSRSITEAVQILEDEIGAAERQPRGRLRVQIPSGLTAMALAPAVNSFMETYPHIELDILSGDAVPDFIGQQIDAAVIIGSVPEADIVARPLGRIPSTTAAAPRYIERHGVPATVADLSRHRCVAAIIPGSGQRAPWRFHIAGKDAQLRVDGRLAFESPMAAVAAAVWGAGIVQFASYLLYSDIRAGRLVEVLEDARPRGVGLHLVHPRHRLKPKKLKIFEQFLRQLDVETRQKWRIKAVS
ncbi:LysR family transcriptional regulator [Hoeflea halophila]|uniref:LysR family transcriptional regulator n=1 Tax=Hoeflea halophila TaxID=714899 RepID=A0A286IBL1_9HYPH|nr:LysR family transcriptional regulator [Hoeflea halophila]SOE17523.1 LysR family transcriptional regulator [Hoeflea halophila]